MWSSPLTVVPILLPNRSSKRSKGENTQLERHLDFYLFGRMSVGGTVVKSKPHTSSDTCPVTIYSLTNHWPF